MKGLELYSIDQFSHMKEVAKAIWESGQVQKPWIKNPQTVLLVMQKAIDLGMSPLAGLDHLTQFRDGGKWGISFDGARGLVAANGGTIALTEDSDTKSTVKVTRPQWADHFETATMAECEKSGVTGKDVWKKFPRAMLRSTSIRRALTHMWSDVLVGCSPFDPELESPDQAEASEPITATPEDNKPRRTRRTKAEMEADALAAQEPAQAPQTEETAPAAPADVPPTDPMTGNQGIKISTPFDPPVIPPKKEEAPTENPFADPLKKEPAAPAAEPPTAEAFDLNLMPHRMMLIEAIKSAGLTPDQIKICRDSWQKGWAKENNVILTLDSITAGLKKCCGA